MEEKIALALETLLKELQSSSDKYLVALAAKTPTMVLKPFYIVQLGEFDVGKIEGNPALSIVPIGWNMKSDNITYAIDENIENIYRFYLEIFVEGDDAKQVTTRIMRYKECIIEKLRANFTLSGVCLGLMVTSSQNSNILGGSGRNLEQGSRMELAVIGFDDTQVHIV